MEGLMVANNMMKIGVERNSDFIKIITKRKMMK